VHRIVARVGAIAGIDDMHPHRLRHTRSRPRRSTVACASKRSLRCSDTARSR
jgi:integrase